MNFLDYDNNIQRMTTCYSKESLTEALKIISHYSNYDELRKGVVKAINLYDRKEVAEYRENLAENDLHWDACLLACAYEKKYFAKVFEVKQEDQVFWYLDDRWCENPMFF